MAEFLSLDKHKLSKLSSASSMKASPRLSSARRKKPLIARKVSAKKSDNSSSKDGRKSVNDSKK